MNWKQLQEIFSKIFIIYSSDKVTIHTTKKYYEYPFLVFLQSKVALDLSKIRNIHKTHAVPKLDFILHIVIENKRLLCDALALRRYPWRCSETSCNRGIEMREWHNMKITFTFVF